jgi:hypothetical protein
MCNRYKELQEHIPYYDISRFIPKIFLVLENPFRSSVGTIHTNTEITFWFNGDLSPTNQILEVQKKSFN